MAARAAPMQAAPTPLTAATGTEIIPLGEKPQATVHHGTAPATLPPAGTAPSVAVSPGGDVTLNFTDADIREVVRAVVGDILGLNYFVDAKVQGTVTVQTSRPLPRAAVLPTLGRVLRASGAALLEDDGMIRITPLDVAAKGTAVQPTLGSGVRVVPLQYVEAAQIQKVLEPFVPTGALVQVDPVHNILVLSGSRDDMTSLADLVQTFDADWLTRMSFALVPLQVGPAETVANEMTAIIAGAAGGAEGATGELRLVPIDRLNAVLVITAQARYLDWARQQIEALDAGSLDSAERTYIYHVQYGRASDLAEVLTRVYGGGGAATGANTTSSSSSLSTTFPQSSFSSAAPSISGGSSVPSSGASSLGAAPAGGATSMGGLGGATSPLSNVLGAANGTTPGGPSASTNSTAAPETPPTPGQPSVRVVTDERNNALVIVTTPHEYRRVEETLHRLDVRPLQVAIEATVAEVTLNNELQFGLQWFFRNGSGTNSAAFTNVTTSTPTQVFPGFSYILNEANVQVVLNALSSITNVNVVSSPQLMVLNNQTAQIQVGQQVPVPVEQQQSTLVAGAPLVNTISYVDTGVILQVTPRANATGEVTLDIEQEVSDVASSTTGGLSAPTLDERRIKSTVSVQSGESVALGGLISNSVTKNRSAVPLLADIPVLGALFRNDDNTTTRTELLVLIEPRIINGSSDARAATDELERQMKDIQPLAPRAP
jgi:general secretion pathway protein D